MIMDILHLKTPDIQAMDYIEWNEAVNYSATMVRMRSMTTTEKGKGTGNETIHYNQPKDYDYDPKFYSKVN